MKIAKLCATFYTREGLININMQEREREKSRRENETRLEDLPVLFELYPRRWPLGSKRVA
jgi:hypothetical protein